jgi:hypothetical protein
MDCTALGNFDAGSYSRLPMLTSTSRPLFSVRRQTCSTSNRHWTSMSRRFSLWIARLLLKATTRHLPTTNVQRLSKQSVTLRNHIVKGSLSDRHPFSDLSACSRLRPYSRPPPCFRQLHRPSTAPTAAASLSLMHRQSNGRLLGPTHLEMSQVLRSDIGNNALKSAPGSNTVAHTGLILRIGLYTDASLILIRRHPLTRGWRFRRLSRSDGSDCELTRLDTYIFARAAAKLFGAQRFLARAIASSSSSKPGTQIFRGQTRFCPRCNQPLSSV